MESLDDLQVCLFWGWVEKVYHDPLVAFSKSSPNSSFFSIIPEFFSIRQTLFLGPLSFSQAIISLFAGFLCLEHTTVEVEGGNV